MKISVIVPVYNAEGYIRKCLDSIVGQTYTDFEVLLVDDGSTDYSSQICDEYAKKHPNFKVYHIENSGPSRARNKGLDCAQGIYVTFVDADDWMETNALERYISAIESHQADVVKAGYIKEYKKRNLVVNIDKEEEYTDIESFFVGIEESKYYGFLWNGIYKRSVIGNIRMDETIRWCEDHLFTCEVLLHTNKMVLLPDVLYHYRKTDNTTLSSIKDPWLIFTIANKEYELRQQFIASPNGIAQTLIDNVYNSKMYKTINTLYTVMPYHERKRFKTITKSQLRTEIREDVYMVRLFYSNGSFYYIDLRIMYYRICRNIKKMIKEFVKGLLNIRQEYA